MNKIILRTILFFVTAYLIVVISVYFFQEKLIFHQSKLEQNYVFDFETKFDEINLKTTDNETLNGLLFYAEKPKGVIYFLHGNSGDLSGWGDVAPYFLDNNYDIFICHDCGLLFLNPMITDSELFNMYPEDYYSTNEIENIINETLNKIEQRDNVKNNQGGQNDAGESNTGN